MPQSSWERSALVICVNRRVPQCLFLNVKQWENERKRCKGFLCLFRSLSLFMGEFSFHSKYWQIGELTCGNGVNYVNNLSKQTDKQTLRTRINRNYMKFGYTNKKKFHTVSHTSNSTHGIWKILYEECISIYILYDLQTCVKSLMQRKCAVDDVLFIEESVSAVVQLLYVRLLLSW